MEENRHLFVSIFVDVTVTASVFKLLLLYKWKNITMVPRRIQNRYPGSGCMQRVHRKAGYSVVFQGSCESKCSLLTRQQSILDVLSYLDWLSVYWSCFSWCWLNELSRQIVYTWPRNKTNVNTPIRLSFTIFKIKDQIWGRFFILMIILRYYNRPIHKMILNRDVYSPSSLKSES